MPRRPALSLVVPTLNEAESLPGLLRHVRRALRGVEHEVLIVDDASGDGTAELAERIARNYAAIRVLRRMENPGLSRAIKHGFDHARGSTLAVIDADLQHNPTALPKLLAALDEHDLAVGSRYAFTGGSCGWSVVRETQSRLAAWLTGLVLRTRISDPLSGFFAIRREHYEAVRPRIGGRGWKILLDILAADPGARMADVPYVFRARRLGRTKMRARVVREWLIQLAAIGVARFATRATLSRPAPSAAEAVR